MKSVLSILFCAMISFVATAQQPTNPTTESGEKPINLDSLVNSNVAPTDSLLPQPTEKKEPRMIEIDPVSTRYRYSRDYDRGNVRVKVRGDDGIKTLSRSSNHRGGFGALSFRTTEFRDEAVIMAGVRGGWIISRALAMGFEGHGIIPTLKIDDIKAPSGKSVIPLGGYGGFFLEPIFFSNEVIHITVPISAGAGWIGYQEDWENTLIGSSMKSSRLIDEDVFWYIEPGVALELNVARNFRMNLGVSKRMTEDLKLVNTDATSFDTWSMFLGLKIGSF
jgi:hypothetical protein